MLSQSNPKNRYSVCRVLNGCALVKVASFGDLRAAKTYMQRIAAQTPDSYIVFSKRSRRVLARSEERTRLIERPSRKTISAAANAI